REASIIEVLERKNSRLVGRLFAERGVMFVVAENKRISQDILVEPGHDLGAKPGQVVMVELVAQPAKNAEPIARVIEVLGNYTDPGMEIEIALRKHDLPHEWPEAVLAAEKKIPKKVTAAEIKGREDLRKLDFVTIDGETAKDFDDAVYCETQGKGFRLLVAIADVSSYVRPGDAFDREARTRGTSVYFPRRVIPMLPEALSNEMCSLKPKVDRLALVCEMSVSAAGEIKRSRFFEAVFHSAARLTYTQVAKALYERDPAHGIDPRLIPRLDSLDGVFRALLAARVKRGAIDFETTETIMEFDDAGKIVRIVPSVRNDAHRLIEECMLAANVSAANFLIGEGHAGLFRIHETPAEDRLEQLRTMLKDFALVLAGGKEPKPSDYAALLEKIKARPDAPLLQTVLLRSMKQAVYSPDNVGHFGLAYDAYLHFTSPIRRYPDLLTHRAIKAALRGETYDPKEPWAALGEHCSMTERRADEATRDVTSWLKCYYMKDRLGEEFAGTVSGVTSFGIFVTLDDVYVEGLVHISDLGQDYFHYDQARHQIVGERTRKKYQLADRVNIKVARVDIETARVDFVLIGERLKKAVPLPENIAPDPARAVVKPAMEKLASLVAPKPAPQKSPAGPKVLINVDSSNPPVTPMEGLTAMGKAKAPAGRVSKARQADGAAPAPRAVEGTKKARELEPKKPAGKGALLTRKKT
ncbi:MAG TPA: ribonuclease R, partial [Usitatibacteraceae bacterium]|nr:ribonuclease R [Usitatibacteraceae bacterium]